MFTSCEVSILVLLEVSLRQGGREWEKIATEVSILVLLEVSLRPSLAMRTESIQQSFNPCFIGSISEAYRRRLVRLLRENVSILVLLEVSLRHRLTGRDEYSACVFQSLFYWKYL